jgi:CheY-like chemotaxis protein
MSPSEKLSQGTADDDFEAACAAALAELLAEEGFIPPDRSNIRCVDRTPEDLSLSLCEESPANSNDDGTSCVMIIDDDPTTRTGIEELIKVKRPGQFEISQAIDANNAIKQLLETRGVGHRLIVTDNTMPGMTGSELAKFLRGQTINGRVLDQDIVENLRGVPIVMFTGDISIDDILELVGSGVLQEIFRKPFRIEDIERMLLDHVDARVAEVIEQVA